MRKQETHPRTVIVNKKQKNLTKKARQDALAWLANKFPKAFNNAISIHPLKRGVMADIFAYSEEAKQDGISKSKLREAVVIFTRRIDYLTCLKAREMRIDLEGNPTSQVTEEEAVNATLKIKKYIEKSIKNSKKNELATPMSTLSCFELNDRDAKFELNERETKPKRVATSVIIKQKTNRSYDAEAIIRLKEKLGLAKKEIFQ